MGINIGLVEKVTAEFQKLDPNDVQGVEKVLFKAYPVLINPAFMTQMDKARRKTPLPAKYTLIQQFVDNKGGTLRVGQDGLLTYVPQAVKNTATKSNFGSGGTQGMTSFGGMG